MRQRPFFQSLGLALVCATFAMMVTVPPRVLAISPSIISRMYGGSGTSSEVTAISSTLKAADPDTSVNSATMTSPASTDLALASVIPATTHGMTASVTLTGSATTEPGTYPVTIQVLSNQGQTTMIRVQPQVNLANACTDAVQPIGDVQGSDAGTPLDGQAVSVRGIVTRLYTDTDAVDQGFYLQDAGDTNEATSDGVFVNAPLGTVVTGTLVAVTGQVGERFGQTQIANTQSVLLCEGTLTITPVDLTLPVTSTTSLEPFEGMLVRLPQTLTLLEYFNLNNFGEIVLGSGRQETPTNEIDPNDDPASGTTNDGNSNVAAVTAAQTANRLARITVDDGSGNAFPALPAPFGPNVVFRGGDTTTNVTGVLGYGFNLYRVHPTLPLSFTTTNPRPDAPENVGGNIQVSAFNVLNYFNTLDAPGSACFTGTSTEVGNCRGAHSTVEFERQRAKIFAALRGLDADIFGLLELENDGNGADSAIADLVNGLNASLPVGAAPYDYISNPEGYGPGSATLLPGGDDAIKVALIYRPSVATPVGSALASASTAFENARAPLAQTFRLTSNNAIFSVVVNHFKSKSGSGTGGDADLGDGQGAFNATRVAQAEALLDFISTEVISNTTGANGDTDVLVLGDLNAYAQEDPIDTLRAGGLVDQIEKRVENPYSYVFDGQIGYLDHALTTASLDVQVTGITEWHINADEPDIRDYNDAIIDPNESGSERQINPNGYYEATPYRSSDHDPVLIGLSLRADGPSRIYAPLIMR